MSDQTFPALLPQSVSSDGSIRVIANALDSHLANADASIASILLMARLWGDGQLSPALEHLVQKSGGLRQLEEDLLDHLAWQLHVDDYDLAETYAAKLDMVRLSIALHRKKGTPWAVRRALEAAFQDAQATVVEWFDYGAPAYHFRVFMDLSGKGIVKNDISRALRLIESNKSKRSLCDGMTIALASRADVRVGSAVLMGNHIRIEPEINDYLELTPPAMSFGLGVHIDGAMTIPADLFDISDYLELPPPAMSFGFGVHIDGTMTIPAASSD